MGHFHFSPESKGTWSYQEITVYTSACCYRIRRIATSSAHKCLFTVCKVCQTRQELIWLHKKNDGKDGKNLIQPLSLFISTSSTARHYLWVDRPQTPFHHRWTCKSLANEAAIFCTDSLFPSPWLRNFALHSAAFSGKKRVLLRWMQSISLLHSCDLIANNTTVSMCSLLKTQETRASSILFSTAGMLAWDDINTVIVPRVPYGRVLSVPGKSCRWNLNTARTGYLWLLLRCVYSFKRLK
jgi:hypothetical protein